jgi:mycothiol synthase
MAMMDANQLVIRSFSTVQDIPRVLALYAEIEKHDQAGLDISVEALQQQLILDGHDPETDRWVVEAPGDSTSLIASAQLRVSPSTHTADGNILVHPEYRCQGIGTRLLSSLRQRAVEQQSAALRIFADTRLPASVKFLNKYGFAPQGAYTELQLTESVRLPPTIWPFGYTLRPYSEVNDLGLLTEIMNLAYIPLWGHQEVSEEEMSAWLPNFNQAGLFLVFSEKGRVIGISRTEPSPERTLKNGVPTGYIDAPGIVPQHRRLDLYRALVLTGIHWLKEQGQRIIEMESWGDKLEVLKMYRELGFKDLRQLVSYQLAL